jgi:hypothetical protein
LSPGTLTAFIFNADGVHYDLIIGCQALKKMQLQLYFQQERLIWFDSALPFHPINWLQDTSTIQSVLQVSPAAVNCLVTVSASTYFKADIPQALAQQTHLTFSHATISRKSSTQQSSGDPGLSCLSILRQSWHLSSQEVLYHFESCDPASPSSQR